MNGKHFLKNPLITGTLLLTLAGVLSRIIGFFYRIFLSRTIGAEGLGIYQLVFPVMALCFSITAAGIQTAISRFVSAKAANDDMPGARMYLYCGLVFSSILSIATGCLLWKNATFFATTFLHEIRCAPLLKILAFSFLPCSIHSCINGFYYGLKKTGIPALSQLVEQLARVGGVYLIYLISASQGKDVTVSVAAWGITLGELAGMLVSLSAVHLKKASGRILSCSKDLMRMIVPLSANRVALNLFSAYENIMIPHQLCLFGYTNAEALSVYGILTGMSLAIILFPTVLTNSVSVLLLPTIAQAQAEHNQKKIATAIQKTIAYCTLLGLLCTIGFLLTGDFIGNFIFQNTLAGTFIRILSWICPFLFLSTTLNSILHGLGHPGVTFVLNLISCFIRILFVLFFVPQFGIRSYLIGTLLGQIFISITAIILLCSNFQKKS